jgi:hypothetical protein
VWASERKAIQEAWGKKLGTPPSDKKIEEIKRNTLLILTPEGIERHEIPNTYKPVQTWSQGHYHGGRAYVPPTTPTTTRKTSTGNGSESSRLSVLTKDIRDTVESMRDRDTHSSRLWDGRHRMEFAVQLGPWQQCDVCKERVHHEDLRDSLKGVICDDCYGAWMTLSAAARGVVGENNTILKESDFEDVNKTFDKDQIEAFNTWADDEDFVHAMCLRELSIRTGFSEEALEFLLFRLTTTDEGLVEGLREWRQDLIMMYDDEYEENWQLYDADGDKVGMQMLGPEEVVEVEPPKAQLALMPAPTTEVKVRFTPTQAAPKKCGCCRRKVKTVVERVDTHEYIGFCNKHFTQCACRGCHQNPNHTSVDGERLCHEHARGRDAYADSLLLKEGFTDRKA